MNSPAAPHHILASDHSASPVPSSYTSDPDLKHLVASAFAILDQTPPPTLREILGAYRAKGDGDRDMLLAMLNAKSAEDQRLASVAALHRSVLEVYQAPSGHTSPPPPPPRMNGSHHYPTPGFTHSPHLYEQKPRRPHHQHHRVASGSRSPPRVHHHNHLSGLRDPPVAQSEPPRKRHRSSLSPPSPRGYYEPHSGSQLEQLPPSPYSSSGRSDSAEYSPRSRASMAIGSLLSARPNQELNGDDP